MTAFGDAWGECPARLVKNGGRHQVINAVSRTLTRRLGRVEPSPRKQNSIARNGAVRSVWTRGRPCTPKFNRRRALFVLGNFDEILAWGAAEGDREGHQSLSNWGVIYAKFGRDSTGGWRT